MRLSTTTYLTVALTITTTVSAFTGHDAFEKRGHALGKRMLHWGRRDLNIAPSSTYASATLTTVADPSTTSLDPLIAALPTAVPDGAAGPVTIYNIDPAAAEETGAAQGVDRGSTSPLAGCGSSAGFMGYCNPVSSNCCAAGLTCSGNTCIRVCPITALEAYCDASTPCDTTNGYTCTGSRCRPPVGAVRVDVGAACDQGTLNTAFCIPGKAICIDQVCAVCTQHS